MKKLFILFFAIWLNADILAYPAANKIYQDEIESIIETIIKNNAKKPSKFAKNQTILLIGDSIMEGIYLGFKNNIKNTDFRLVSVARQNTGLVNKKYFNWQEALKLELKKLKGNVLVVAHFGPNDMLNAKSGGKYLTFGLSGWQNFYANEVQKIYDISRNFGAKVAWVEVPCMNRDDLKKNMPILNKIYHKKAIENGGNFVMTRTILCNDDEMLYHKQIAGKNVKIRAKDGIHLTTGGAKIIANKILKDL